MENNIKNLIVPVLPLRGLVVFPQSLIHFDVGRSKSVTAINKAMRRDQLIFLTAQKDAASNDPSLSDLYSVGVVAKIVQVLKQPENSTRIVIEGLYRAKICSQVFDDACLTAEVKMLVSPDEERVAPTVRETALLRAVRREFEEYIDIAPKIPPDIIFKVALCKYSGELADFITANIILDFHTKQSVLETINPGDRLELLHSILVNENQILRIEDEISQKAKQRIDESQRDFFLREQKRAIEEELGEDDNPSAEAEDYAERIEELKLDEKSEETLFKECRKLMKMPYGSQEASVIRTYLDTVLELPWHTSTKDKINIQSIRKS
ncbi:MAG: LON peptidase substrate-binding domain-containing protein, partial [Ruminococcus sp.]|nr:LON peptidase substrate-binding domain-containing protein [Ruminococcus sp.]